MLVPPDPLRRFVDKRQIKPIYERQRAGQRARLRLRRPGRERGLQRRGRVLRMGSARGARLPVHLDRHALRGRRRRAVPEREHRRSRSSSGSSASCETATAQRQAGRAVRPPPDPVSLTPNVPDEAAGPCTGVDHTTATCPSTTRTRAATSTRATRSRSTSASRASGRRRHARDLVELLDRYPHVIAYVAGHTHENRVTPFTRPGGGVWWGIETSAEADWPVQHRLLEVMDNRDGTLSIFGTILDAAAASAAPAPGPARRLRRGKLASLGREFAYNDPQAGRRHGRGRPRGPERRAAGARPAPPRRATRGRSGRRRCARRWCPPTSVRLAQPPARPAARVGSCKPAQQDVGLPDRGNGRLQRQGDQIRRIRALRGPGRRSPTAVDEADVKLTVNINDVRLKAGLAGYGGELKAQTVLKITDHQNGPFADEAATVTEFPFPFTVPCVGLANPTDGRPAQSTPPPTRWSTAWCPRANARSGRWASGRSMTAGRMGMCRRRMATRCLCGRGFLRLRAKGSRGRS